MEDEQALNSLSRRGNIYICNACGDEEAFVDMGKMSPSETEVEFVKWLETHLL